MSNPHIVKAFDQELESLTRNIQVMGEFAGIQFADAVKALLQGDWTLAQRVIDQDRQLDALRNELSTAAATVIARRQPLAMDLEEVLATFRIAEDLERIGDLAKNIAKRATAITGHRFAPEVIGRLETLSNLALVHLRSALTAVASRDSQQALVVRAQDDQIDSLYTNIFRDLVARLSADPAQAIGLVHVLFCAKNIERIADHATHIAESAYLITTGHYPDAQPAPH